MTPEIKQAYNKWADEQGIEGIASTFTLPAFEAGYNAALASIAQLEHLIDKQEMRVAPPLEAPITAEAIYAAYPRKVGRSGAIKAILKAGKGVGMERLLKAVKAYAEATSRWPVEERQYVPFPATWFNRGSYDDDPKEWERGTAQASQFSQYH